MCVCVCVCVCASVDLSGNPTEKPTGDDPTAQITNRPTEKPTGDDPTDDGSADDLFDDDDSQTKGQQSKGTLVNKLHKSQQIN